MTIIVAYEDKNSICIGSDSCGLYDGIKTDHGSKIIKKGNYYIGFSGSYRIKDVILEAKSLPKKIDKQKDMYSLRDALRDEIIEQMNASIIDEENENNSTHPLSIIVISKLGIQEIQDNYSILEYIDKFTALGAGREVALGCLATHKLYSCDAYNAVKETLKTTIKYCTNTGGKIYIKTIKQYG